MCRKCLPLSLSRDSRCTALSIADTLASICGNITYTPLCPPPAFAILCKMWLCGSLKIEMPQSAPASWEKKLWFCQDISTAKQKLCINKLWILVYVLKCICAYLSTHCALGCRSHFAWLANKALAWSCSTGCLCLQHPFCRPVCGLCAHWSGELVA